ncbi:GAF domain-containing protein [Paracraurococcus ruber]|uniref:Histidine kinase n=1 Tax=Paracraurococcus ruber TaxID=77675 RepID=A0ABS1D5I4_9PROT|nr:GAF domain-containing protein [Paracraurococcus ruber]MBK1662141.1 hypothetical protein [Paracraurococcus ruber]TDG31156.1 GAF domain-containing protein [Paracraurococcus ruber]
MPESPPRFGAADLTNCDREPIHLPGSIQPHGALLSLEAGTTVVRQAAGATARLLRADPGLLPGCEAGSLLPAALAERLRGMDLPPGQPPLHLARHRRDDIEIDVLVHRSGPRLVVEFEPIEAPEPADAFATGKRCIEQLRGATTLDQLLDLAVALLRSLTGFDRVMAYRFQHDESGMVVAEARGAGAESFLGLRYPASDIPVQARTLYRRNWTRYIPDALYRPAPLFGGPAEPPLDLSMSVLRSVSPLHLEYLGNMGVQASLSLSLLVAGRLWGLIVGHHRTPRYLAPRTRALCEMIAQAVSAQVEALSVAVGMRARLSAARAQDALLGEMSGYDGIAQGLKRVLPCLQDYLPAEGVALWVDRDFTGLGRTPGVASVSKLVGWLDENATDGVFHTDCLPEICPELAQEAEVASGLLALSVSRSSRDYILWFRGEMPRQVTWAGNPRKPVETTRDGKRLTPRRSFAAWHETVRNHSAPWEAHEVEAARSLRTALLDVVLQRIDQLAQATERARIKQELLTAELDRRLEQWQGVVGELQAEGRRRARVEAELSQVLRRTVEDQEEERRRISRELHDTAGQTLTLLQIGMDQLAEDYPADQHLAARIGALKATVATLSGELGRMARDLRPTMLDDLGLQAALGVLVEGLQEQTGMRIGLRDGIGSRRLPPDVETCLYRVAQEALTNIVRHAGATRVDIALDLTGQDAVLVVADNGRGFQPAGAAGSRLPGSRLGLLGIRERVAQVGGRVAIDTTPGRGTRLAATVPV